MWLFLQLNDYAIMVWPVHRKQRVRQQMRRLQVQQQVLQRRQQQEPKRGPVQALVPEQVLLEVVVGGEVQFH